MSNSDKWPSLESLPQPFVAAVTNWASAKGQDGSQALCEMLSQASEILIPRHISLRNCRILAHAWAWQKNTAEFALERPFEENDLPAYVLEAENINNLSKNRTKSLFPLLIDELVHQSGPLCDFVNDLPSDRDRKLFLAFVISSTAEQTSKSYPVGDKRCAWQWAIQEYYSDIWPSLESLPQPFVAAVTNWASAKGQGGSQALCEMLSQASKVLVPGHISFQSCRFLAHAWPFQSNSGRFARITPSENMPASVTDENINKLLKNRTKLLFPRLIRELVNQSDPLGDFMNNLPNYIDRKLFLALVISTTAEQTSKSYPVGKKRRAWQMATEGYWAMRYGKGKKDKHPGPSLNALASRKREMLDMLAALNGLRSVDHGAELLAMIALCVCHTQYCRPRRGLVPPTELRSLGAGEKHRDEFEQSVLHVGGEQAVSDKVVDVIARYGVKEAVPQLLTRALPGAREAAETLLWWITSNGEVPPTERFSCGNELIFELTNYLVPTARTGDDLGDCEQWLAEKF